MQVSVIDAKYAESIPRKDKPNRITIPKSGSKRTFLKMFWKYTFGSTRSNPWKIDAKIRIKTEKGIAIANIFTGVANSGL